MTAESKKLMHQWITWSVGIAVAVLMTIGAWFGGQARAEGATAEKVATLQANVASLTAEVRETQRSQEAFNSMVGSDLAAMRTDVSWLRQYLQRGGERP